MSNPNVARLAAFTLAAFVLVSLLALDVMVTHDTRQALMLHQMAGNAPRYPMTFQVYSLPNDLILAKASTGVWCRQVRRQEPRMATAEWGDTVSVVAWVETQTPATSKLTTAMAPTEVVLNLPSGQSCPGA